MIPNIVLTQIPSFLPGFIGLIIFLSAIFIVFTLMSLFVKKRSTISGIMFLLAISGICTFICSFERDGVSLLDNIASFNNDYGIGEGLAYAIQAIGSPVYYTHKLFIKMIADISSLEVSDEKLTILNDGIFDMIIYIVLFLLSFIFFNRNKKTKKIYSDYLS